MSDDRTFCSKRDCKHTKCTLHQSNIKNKCRYRSVADYENTEYCKLFSMRKEKILEFFNDINYAYNNSRMHESLSIMLDELDQESRNKAIDEFAEEFNLNILADDNFMFDRVTLYKIVKKTAEMMKGE